MPVGALSRTFVGIALVALFLSSLVSALPAGAQMPALLPSRFDVPESEPLPIDGVWTISTIGKRIHIQQGRAFVIDPWLHLFVMQIQTDMVVLRNVRSIGAGRYTAEDLPLAGPATLTLLPDGNISVHVKGALAPVSYTLLRQTPDDPSALEAEIAAIGGEAPPPTAETPPAVTPPPVEAPPESSPPPSEAPPSDAPPAGGSPLASCTNLGVDPNTGNIVCND